VLGKVVVIFSFLFFFVGGFKGLEEFCFLFISGFFIKTVFCKLGLFLSECFCLCSLLLCSIDQNHWFLLLLLNAFVQVVQFGIQSFYLLTSLNKLLTTG
jgi:hypothetical protein